MDAQATARLSVTYSQALRFMKVLQICYERTAKNKLSKGNFKYLQELKNKQPN